MKLNGFIDFYFIKTGRLVDVGKVVERPHYFTFEYQGREYLVLTDEEADEMVHSRLIETLHLMRPLYFAQETDMPEYIFAHILKLYEDATEILEAVIQRYASGGMAGFMKRMMQSLGRGQVLASYNHQEEFHADLFFYRIS
jgi:hypothetical protein